MWSHCVHIIISKCFYGKKWNVTMKKKMFGDRVWRMIVMWYLEGFYKLFYPEGNPEVLLMKCGLQRFFFSFFLSIQNSYNISTKLKINLHTQPY